MARRIPLPPPRLRFMKDSDERFLAVGDETLALLREHGGLGPASTVVDVGCGYGRLAHALLRWEAFEGRYLGVDVLRKHLRWCGRRLARHVDGRVEFHHLDVRNQRYNPNGSLDPATVRLPPPDAWADVVVLLSLFTHMYAEEVSHYLDEVARILKPGGRACATLLLLNDDWERAAAAKRTAYRLPHRLGETSRTMRLDEPLHAIAHDERWVLDRLAAAGLAPAGPILHGTWTGRASGATFQDLVVARRAG